MRAINHSGSRDNKGIAAVCASCLIDFDVRGGVLFDSKYVRPEGAVGICADCANQVVAALSDKSGEDF